MALLRKNAMPVGHDASGENHAILLSLVASCKRHKVNPAQQVADVLLRVQTHPNSRTDELLPHNWKTLFQLGAGCAGCTRGTDNAIRNAQNCVCGARVERVRASSNYRPGALGGGHQPTPPSPGIVQAPPFEQFGCSASQNCVHRPFRHTSP